MRTYLLSPRRDGAADPDWACSSYRGPCMVIAPSAEHARRYAAGAFVLPLIPEEGKGARSPGQAAWLQERLVAVLAAPAGSDTALPEGGVIAPGHDCPTLRAQVARAAEAPADAGLPSGARTAPAARPPGAARSRPATPPPFPARAPLAAG